MSDNDRPQLDLLRYRLFLGLTLMQFSNYLAHYGAGGITGQTLSNLERNKTEPEQYTVRAIANALGISPFDLYRFEDSHALWKERLERLPAVPAAILADEKAGQKKKKADIDEVLAVTGGVAKPIPAQPAKPITDFVVLMTKLNSRQAKFVANSVEQTSEFQGEKLVRFVSEDGVTVAFRSVADLTGARLGLLIAGELHRSHPGVDWKDFDVQEAKGLDAVRIMGEVAKRLNWTGDLPTVYDVVGRYVRFWNDMTGGLVGLIEEPAT